MELVTQADPGRNNAGMAGLSRIIEGGTWKKQRIVTLVPTGKMIHYRAVHSWMNLIFPPNQAQARWPTWMVQGDEVGIAYSRSIDQILDHPDLGTWEYVLTIETDNLPPADGVLKLVRRMEAHPEFGCVGGLYWTKHENGVPQIWGDPRDPVLNFRPQAPVPGQLVECCGTGMGFNLWRMSMLRDVRERMRQANHGQPVELFKTKASASEGVGTQDLAFWMEARKYGHRCAVDCDVLVGHLDANTGICW